MDIRREGIKISSYTSGFNLIKNEFDWEKVLLNHAKLADEVVVAINTSEDNTLDLVSSFAESNEKIKVIETDFSYLDPDLDGKIKNAALQETQYDIKVGLDMDEVIDPDQKERWIDLSLTLLYSRDLKAYFVPVIDLYENKHSYKSVGQKWYIHEKGLYRGTVNFAKNKDGTHDTNRSDSCELIDEKGELVHTSAMILLDGTHTDEEILVQIAEQNLPRIFHLGYLNLKKKILRNKNFWKKHWSIEAGKDVFVPTSTEELQSLLQADSLFAIRNHNLNVSFL